MLKYLICLSKISLICLFLKYFLNYQKEGWVKGEKMKAINKLLGVVTVLFCSVLFAGCVTPGTTTTVTSGQGSPSMGEVRAESYNGPKARIAVAQFKNKAGNRGGWWNPEIGNGMADQLVTALFNTNRFIVLERQTLDNVLAEQDLGASGRIKKGTEAAIGEIEGAELLVVAAVTEFDPGASGARGALGGGGGGILGALTGGFKKAHMAIDLRVIDTRTSRILAATSVEGASTDVNLGGALGGYWGGGALGGALGGWKNTPKEKALRQVINKAVEFIVTKTPQKFYHYGGNARTATPAAAPAGPSRAVVKEMQEKLNSLGYNTGTPDGLAGKKTRAAVSAFQKDYGLPENGQLNPGTIKLLRKLSSK